MARFLNPLAAFRRGSGPAKIAGRGGSPIRAVVRPTIVPAVDGDDLAVLPADWNQASNYTSPAGSITVTASSLTVNGVAAQVGSPLGEGDVVALSVTVTDGANVRVFGTSFTVPALSNWLLSGGVWSDAGEWDDTAAWSDAA